MGYEMILAPLKMEEVDDRVVAHAAYVAGLCGARVTLLVVDHIHTRDAGAYLREKSRAYLAEMGFTAFMNERHCCAQRVALQRRAQHDQV